MIAQPQPFDIDTIRYVIGQAESLEEILGGIDADRLGPDFQKAKDAAYTLRRYLEIELTQYTDHDDQS